VFVTLCQNPTYVVENKMLKSPGLNTRTCISIWIKLIISWLISINSPQTPVDNLPVFRVPSCRPKPIGFPKWLLGFDLRRFQELCGTCLRVGFCTLPDRRHCAQTFILLTLVPTCTRIFRIFGLKVLLVVLVVFLPTPPLYFASPRRDTLFPTPTRFPQISHALDITSLP